MTWWEYAALGAAGGALVEVLAVFKWITSWQAGRRNKDGTLKAKRADWREYVDVPMHVWLFVLRVPLGALASALLGNTGQITGAIAALGCGIAAPVLLAQLGSIPQVANAVQGDDQLPESAAVGPASSAE
jgi:hypothetical protein